MQEQQKKPDLAQKQQQQAQKAPLNRFKVSFGEDSMIQWSLQYYLIPALYLIAFYSLINGISLTYMFALLFFLVPLLDEFIEVDNKNPTKTEAQIMQNEQRFKFPLYLSVFMDWMYTFYTIKMLANQDISLFNQFMMILVAGMFGGSNINICHELGHKLDSPVDQIVALTSMSKAMYMYFIPEHNFGHHRNVSTPGDPATSKLNQTLFAFYKQTLVGTFISAWEIEGERLLKFNKSIKTVYHYKNKFFWYMANNIILPILIFKFSGPWQAFYFLIIAGLSILFLETINYIEHYGLQRKLLEDGTYEKVNHHHSWNAPHRITNYLLFKLQRHSDHHENSTKPYQILLSHESSPTLPNGYTMMIILALFPSLYFEIMGLCLKMHEKGSQDEQTLIAIQVKVRKLLVQIGIFCIGLITASKFL